MKTPMPAFGLALLLAAGPALATEAFDPGMPPPKVSAKYYKGAEKAVYHVTLKGDEKAYLAVLGNVRNHINALKTTGAKPRVNVVLNGDGVGMLALAKELEFESAARLPGAISEMKEAGVKFNVCYNTLTARKIRADALYDLKTEELVPSGVAEVARLQHLGYLLVKP